MARTVFFSFHHQRDLWRANVVRNSVGGIAAVGFPDASSWEKAQKKGDAAVKKFINKLLDGTSVTVVLIGTDTANSKYVNYEIEKSLSRGNGLLGIHVSNIKDENGSTTSPGSVPDALVNSGAPVYIYEFGKLGDWVEEAYKTANPNVTSKSRMQ